MATAPTGQTFLRFLGALRLECHSRMQQLNSSWKPTGERLRAFTRGQVFRILEHASDLAGIGCRDPGFTASDAVANRQASSVGMVS